jgi:thiosulfate/3-mercaptopyruvate sulfurtransferase
MRPTLTARRSSVGPWLATLATALLLSSLALAPRPAAAQAAPATATLTPLVTPQQLAARAADPSLRVIDIRDGKDEAGKTPFELGHVAGSLPAPYSRWRGPADNPGALPPASKLGALVQSLGIDATTPVVVVYEGANSTDFGAAARVYWTLKAAGLRDLAILNGGVRAWRAAGLPLSTEAPRAVAASRFEARFDPRLIATREDVLQAQQSARGTLLDARPARFFSGETRHTAASTPGTIAGARNVDNAVWFAPKSGALLDTPQVQSIAQAKGIDTTQPTVSFCNTGHWAATNWFVLSEVLGQKDVKMYPESMVDWSRSGLSMDNVPNRLYQFWLQLKEATGNL